MDALDVRLVRTLGIQPFQVWPHPPSELKPGALAKRLGISVDAVKDRMRRLERDGVLAGFEIFPNFRLLGTEVTSYRFRVGDEAKRVRATQDAETVDGVCGVAGFLGPELCVDIAHRSPDELQRRVSLLARLMGDAAATGWYVYHLPPVAREPSPLDWRIVQALRGNARRSLDDVARDVGVSVRTVKRRFDRMTREGAFDIVANFHPESLRGYVMFLLLMGLRPGLTEKETKAILGTFAERWFFSWSPPGAPNPSLFVAMLAPSMGDIEALRREAESIPGVLRAETLVPVQMKTNMRWMDEAIAERARKAEREPVSSPTPRAR